MRLLDRNPMSRKRSAKGAAFTAVERESLLKVPSFHPLEMPQPKKENTNANLFSPCPESQANKINFLGDKSMTTRLETNHIYDSVRVPLNSEGELLCRILTLKQLQRGKSAAKEKERGPG